jgi:hypothetical protein
MKMIITEDMMEERLYNTLQNMRRVNLVALTDDRRYAPINEPSPAAGISAAE